MQSVPQPDEFVSHGRLVRFWLSKKSIQGWPQPQAAHLDFQVVQAISNCA